MNGELDALFREASLRLEQLDTDLDTLLGTISRDDAREILSSLHTLKEKDPDLAEFVKSIKQVRVESKMINVASSDRWEEIYPDKGLSAHRRKDTRVTFDTPFDSKPTVICFVTYLDVHIEADPRFYLEVDAIGPERDGFTLRVEC